MKASQNGGTPKSSILMGFSIINHPAIGVPKYVLTQRNLRPQVGQGTETSQQNARGHAAAAQV